MAKLNALEIHESLNYLNAVIYSPLSYTYHYPQLSLATYMASIEHIKKIKNVRIFTSSPNSTYHPFIPNVYFTKLGFNFFQVIQDHVSNIYFTNQLKNVFIHPELKLLNQLMLKHNLYSLFTDPYYQRFEQACEACITDFKVQSQLRSFKSTLQSWNTKFTYANTSYDKFISFISRETDIFEVHSILIQRHLRSGIEPQFDDPAFCDLPASTITEEKAKKIISAVWRNRKNNDVLGILSKRETDISNTSTIRLIFFVKRTDSDLIEFNQTCLFKTLEPFLTVHDLDSVSIGKTISSMNVDIVPLFQGQHCNYYNLSQIHIGNRLTILKSHIVISDMWLRINNLSSTVAIERGSTEYYRGK